MFDCSEHRFQAKTLQQVEKSLILCWLRLTLLKCLIKYKPKVVLPVGRLVPHFLLVCIARPQPAYPVRIVLVGSQTRYSPRPPAYFRTSSTSPA